jgi:type III secretory pathway lipoprotein EscJ
VLGTWLAWLGMLAGAACNDVTLARGLSDRDATELSAELNRRGIAVTQHEDGENDRYALRVAESAVPAAWEAHTPQCRAEQAPASSALLAMREVALREREHDLEARLQAAIHQLPNVRSATVLITLARPDTQLADLLHPTTVAAPRALVSLVCGRAGACQSQEQLQPLLMAAIPGLNAKNIRVLTQIENVPEVACAELGHIGPLTVTRASLPTLKLWFAASLVLHMLGALALLFLAQRKRRQVSDRRL